jgi:glycosyltransferase involved in cell wall biosynthesis
MKIAVFFDLPAGGASRTMEEILKILEKRHDVTIYHDPQIYSWTSSNRLLTDLESIIFQKIKQHKLAKEIDGQNFDLVFVSHDRHSQAPMILRFLKTPTVFLCQEPTRAYFEQFLDIDSRLPLLNKIYETVNRRIRKGIEIKNAQYASRIVANSRYSVESIFRAFGAKATPVYLGIDAKEYFPSGISQKKQVVVVGNNEPQKDLGLAVLSLAQINKKDRPALVIASPRNSDMLPIKRLAKNKEVVLKLLTDLDQNSLRRVYSESLLTLALAHLEPFGLSVVESLACGTPVVAVNEGGFKETVLDGKTGRLVDRDPQLIAKAIEVLLSDKEKLKKMGQYGVKDVNMRFTWDNTVANLEKIFYETKKDKNRRHHR